MVDPDLGDTLIQYLKLRLDKGEKLKPILSSFHYPKRRPLLPQYITRVYEIDAP